jgi:hypothetical protein
MSSNDFFKLVMKEAMSKVIADGEYYDETDDGRGKFELSSEAEHYIQKVAALAYELSGLISDEYEIDDTFSYSLPNGADD